MPKIGLVGKSALLISQAWAARSISGGKVVDGNCMLPCGTNIATLDLKGTSRLSGPMALPDQRYTSTRTVEGAGGDESVLFDLHGFPRDRCLQKCKATRVYGWGTKSCHDILPGSEEISAGFSLSDIAWSLCCVTDSCGEVHSKQPEVPDPEPDVNALFSCRSGQGEVGKSYSDTDRNSKEACAAQCLVDARCHSFDFTISKRSDACRLYEVNKPRKEGDIGWEKRSYCFGVDIADAVPRLEEGELPFVPLDVIITKKQMM